MLKKGLYLFFLFAVAVLFSQCKQEDPLTICFTGDVLLDRGVRTQIEKHGLPYILDSVAPVFQSADATVVNLECPVTNFVSPVNKRFIFRADPEGLPALRDAGITHAALANNHSLDQGSQGLEDTYIHLMSNGIVPLGYGDTQSSACRPMLIRKRNIEVALFNSVLLPLENWVYLEQDKGICQATVDILIDEIQSFKKNHPDTYIITVLHWGIEYQQHPTPFQRREAYRLIDAGTDAVIGHHPHVIQEEEIYKGKPIIYSLGNFIFDQSKPETSRSVIVEFSLNTSNITYKKYPVQIRNCKPYLSKGFSQ